MALFELRQSGPTRGDCTASYSVTLLKKNITVKQFVEEVLSNDAEWGRISIGGNYFEPDACAWYKYGKLEKEDHQLIPYYDKIITKVKADGGWSLMDYMIEVED